MNRVSRYSSQGLLDASPRRRSPFVVVVVAVVADNVVLVVSVDVDAVVVVASAVAVGGVGFVAVVVVVDARPPSGPCVGRKRTLASSSSSSGVYARSVHIKECFLFLINIGAP